MKQNDEKIMALKASIAKKKAVLKKTKKFSPVTNCNLDLNGGYRVNLHTLSDANVIMGWMIKLNLEIMSARDLGILKTYKASGFLLTEWMTDLKSKLALANKSSEEAKLKAMESKLTKLLSEDKKTELELAEIEAFLEE